LTEVANDDLIHFLQFQSNRQTDIVLCRGATGDGGHRGRVISAPATWEAGRTTWLIWRC